MIIEIPYKKAKGGGRAFAKINGKVVSRHQAILLTENEQPVKKLIGYYRDIFIYDLKQ